MNKKTIILPTLTALMLFSIMSIASACSCIYLENTEDKLENAAYVFTGKISNIQVTGLDKELQETQEATITVMQYWKPTIFPESVNLKVYAPIDTGANCGYNFVEGEEYLIYAHLDTQTGKLSTNSCMGSMLLEQAKNEINDLNEITPAQNQNPSNAEPIESNVFTKLFSWIKNLFS